MWTAITRAPIISRCHETPKHQTQNGDAEKWRASSRRRRARRKADRLSRTAAAGAAPVEFWRSLGLRACARGSQLYQDQTALRTFHRREVREGTQRKIFRLYQSRD